MQPALQTSTSPPYGMRSLLQAMLQWQLVCKLKLSAAQSLTETARLIKQLCMHEEHLHACTQGQGRTLPEGALERGTIRSAPEALVSHPP